VEGMQYILLALSFLGDYWIICMNIIDYGREGMLQALMRRRGLDCMENLIITLSATRSL
jgi:hypothetical protein